MDSHQKFFLILAIISIIIGLVLSIYIFRLRQQTLYIPNTADDMLLGIGMVLFVGGVGTFIYQYTQIMS